MRRTAIPTEYASQAEELAATQERNRLAREIHDNLGHYLTIVNVQIEAAKVTCESDPSRALDALNKAQELAKKGLNSVRESVAALRVSPVQNRPIEDAITGLIEEARTSGIATEFKIIGESGTVESKSALALYRVVQVGLTNIRKHANASHVNIELDFSQADTIGLTLRDDGAGAADTSGGFGLIGLYINIQRIACESAEGKAATAKVKALNDKKVQELAEKNKQLQANQQKLQKSGAVLSDAARGQLEKDIEKIQVDIQRFTQDAQAEVQGLQQQLQVEFQKRLMPVINAVAAERALHVVFSQADSGLVWADAGLDLTAEVIKRFDAVAAPAAPPKPPAQ